MTIGKRLIVLVAVPLLALLASSPGFDSRGSKGARDSSPKLFSAFRPLLNAPSPAPTRRRPAAEVRAHLIRAGTTMTVSLDDLRAQLDAAVAEEI